MDTLFLALPVSWRGTVAQYVGRLHRLHEGKREVRVYDYADLNVRMLANMFDRRCRGYESLGYTVLLPASALPGWPVEVPLPIEPEWKQNYAASVRRLIRDGVDVPLANLFVHAARSPSPDAEGAARARSASEAFLYRRLETLAETAGRFRLNTELPIPFDNRGVMEVDFLCAEARLVDRIGRRATSRRCGCLSARPAKGRAVAAARLSCPALSRRGRGEAVGLRAGYHSGGTCTLSSQESMKAIQGYHLIKPEDLYWRPSNLMRIPNADYLERTGSENIGARLWRLPPKSANTLHKHIRAEEFYFVLEGTGRMRVGDETLTVPRYGGVLVGPDQLRQVFNDTDAEVLWLIIGAPEELEFLQGSKSKMDLSLIYPTDPTQLPKELAGVQWPPKG